MIKYVYFDIFYTELWIDEFMARIGLDTDSVKNDQALNLAFENNGFGSKQFLKNAGSSLIFISIYMIVLLAILLLEMLFKFSSKVSVIH